MYFMYFMNFMNRFYQLLVKHCYTFTIVIVILFSDMIECMMNLNIGQYNIMGQILFFAIVGITGSLTLIAFYADFTVIKDECEKNYCIKMHVRVIKIEKVGFFSHKFKNYEKLDCPEEETVQYQLAQGLDFITFVYKGKNASIPRKRISRVFAYENGLVEYTYSRFRL